MSYLADTLVVLTAGAIATLTYSILLPIFMLVFVNMASLASLTFGALRKTIRRK